MTYGNVSRLAQSVTVCRTKGPKPAPEMGRARGMELELADLHVLAAVMFGAR